ncbi:MAG: hypothetical protein KJ811_00030, partial [Candidatus Margulisbacteria bacterium]|nr:hypothetical protein [Candidatus Margulisiibacteriota bacterium]
EGEFKQPDLPWLSQNWIRMILRVADRREKILLIKAMSGARKASVIIVSPDCSLKQLEVLLPQNISPLEALMIVDPASALKVVRASLPGVSNIAGVSLDLTTPVPGGMGHIDFRLGNKIQSRNYARLLNDPMARFSYRKFLEQSDKQFQIEVGKMILEPHLERQWLGFSDLAHFAGDEFHDLLSRLAQAKLSVAFVMDWLRSHIFGDDSEVVALKRITFDMMLGTEPRLLSKLNSLFPTDCFAVQKSQVQFALSLTNAVQERQLARLLAMLSPHIEKIETLVPPIIDDKCLRPDGIYYAHRVAEKARQAIQAQEGFVYGFSLKPGANFDQRYAEVIRTARILFFSGGKEQLTGFREELMSFVPREFNEDFPIIVLMNGRHSGLDVSNIVGSLMDGSQVSSEEYFSGFFLEHLRQRAAVIR